MRVKFGTVNGQCTHMSEVTKLIRKKSTERILECVVQNSDFIILDVRVKFGTVNWSRYSYTRSDKN